MRIWAYVGQYKGTLPFSGRPRAKILRLVAGKGERPLFGELQDTVPRGDLDHVARCEIAHEDALRERVLELVLDRALQRPGAVHRIEPGFAELVARRIVEYQPDVALGQPLAQIADLYLDDAPDVLAAQGMEHDDLVDPVDELGTE